MRLAIVGASKGIGRDIQQPLRDLFGYDVTALPRDWMPPEYCQALLLCQRYRGPDDWFGDFHTTLTRTKDLCEWAGAHMTQGSIVLMASVAGVSVEEEQPVSYHVAKAGMLAMMRYYAKTLAPNVRVNAIIPGLTIKPEARDFYQAHPELERLYEAVTPMRRTCSVVDLAEAVEYLVRSPYVNGVELPVDGGIRLTSPWALARKITPAVKDLQVTQRAVTHV